MGGMIRIVASHEFGEGTPGNALLGEGWNKPSADGVWTNGAASTLSIQADGGRGDLVLEFVLDPQLEWPHIRPCTVCVSAAQCDLGARTFSGPLTWQVAVPAAASTKGAADLAITITTGIENGPGVRLSRLNVLRVLDAKPPPPVRPARAFTFGWNAPDNHLLTEGWGQPEDGYVWAIGGRSTLRIPVDGGGGRALALIDMRPFQHEKAPPQQRVDVTVPGCPLQQIILADRLTVAVPLIHQPGATEITLHFDNHDADFPTEDPLYHFGKPFAWAIASLRIVPAIPGTTPGYRPPLPGNIADGSLPATVQLLTGMTADILASGFEALGNGCELGNLQISLGQDRAGLLRYCAIRQRELVEGLFTGFAGVFRPDRMHWAVRREQDDTWRLIEATYGVSAATPYKRDIPPPEDGLQAASVRNPWLAGKLMQDIAEAEKIFVVRISEPVDEAGIMAVLATLRHYGNAMVLWLVTDGSLPPGSVERLPCGLLRGHLESPASGREISPESMLSALANAWVLLRQARWDLEPGA